MHFITSSKLFRYTCMWVNKFIFPFFAWSVILKQSTPSIFALLGFFGCCGVPVFRCSGVLVLRCSGVPVFLLLVHASSLHCFSFLRSRGTRERILILFAGPRSRDFGRPYKFFQGLSDSFLCPVDPKARLGHHSLVKACKRPRPGLDGDRCWGNVHLLKIENFGQIFRKWKSGHL